MTSGERRHAYGRVADHPDDFRATPADLEIFDPEVVLGAYRRLEAILDVCPVDIYAASSLKHPWPYRLQNAKECYPASFWRSQHRILDSAITAPDIDNEEVLAHAVDRHATAVVAVDYLPFDVYDEMPLAVDGEAALDELRATYTDNIAATTASIREFVDVHDPARHPPAYIPLHPPYAEHVHEVYPLIEASHLAHRYMLGGLKDAGPAERVDQLLSFRAEVGSEPVAHGLGWGLAADLVAVLRDDPALLDSVDNSGPAQAIQNDRVLDKHWQAAPCAQVDGQYQNAIGGAFEFAMLLQGAHRLTAFNDDFETQQADVTDFLGVGADD